MDYVRGPAGGDMTPEARSPRSSAADRYLGRTGRGTAPRSVGRKAPHLAARSGVTSRGRTGQAYLFFRDGLSMQAASPRAGEETCVIRLFMTASGTRPACTFLEDQA